MLDPDCERPEAESLLAELARGSRLLRLLGTSPHHRIGPLLAARIAELGIDTDAPELSALCGALDHLAARCALRSQLLRRQLGAVISLLAQRGIPVCLIKGAVCLADEAPDGYLPGAVRPMEDIDIVVAPDQGEAARSVMAERGWLCVSGTQPVTFSIDAPALVDVHVWSPRNESLGFLGFEEFFDRAPKIAVGGREASALRSQCSVQLRLVHNVIRQHLFIDFPLLELHQMSSVISAHADEIDWARIRSIGLMSGVSRVFYAILLRLRDEFGAPVPGGVIPPAERRAAARVLRLLERFSAVPTRLYCAASRSALISAMPGGPMDRVNRVCTELFSEPLRRSAGSGPLARIALPPRMLALHLAFFCWKMLRA